MLFVVVVAFVVIVVIVVVVVVDVVDVVIVVVVVVVVVVVAWRQFLPSSRITTHSIDQLFHQPSSPLQATATAATAHWSKSQQS